MLAIHDWHSMELLGDAKSAFEPKNKTVKIEALKKKNKKILHEALIE